MPCARNIFRMCMACIDTGGRHWKSVTFIELLKNQYPRRLLFRRQSLVRRSACMCVCLCVCLCVCIYIYIYIYIYKNQKLSGSVGSRTQFLSSRKRIWIKRIWKEKFPTKENSRTYGESSGWSISRITGRSVGLLCGKWNDGRDSWLQM